MIRGDSRLRDTAVPGRVPQPLQAHVTMYAGALTAAPEVTETCRTGGQPSGSTTNLPNRKRQMSLYDGNNVVHFKRPMTPLDACAKTPGGTASGNRQSESGRVIRFPDARSGAIPIDRVQRRREHSCANTSAAPITSANLLTGWPARSTHERDAGAALPPHDAESRLAALDRRAIERGEDDGMRIETE